MSRKTLTSAKRSFGKNPDTFPLETGEDVVVTVDSPSDPLTPTTTIVINTKSLEASGINGEDLGGVVKVQRRSQYVAKLDVD